MSIKKTLLEMTQSILSDMDSDEVNSISDTVEALQVAGIIRDSYYYLISFNDFPEHKEIFTLDALGDTTKPNYLKVPSNVSLIEWLRYDTQTLTDTDVSYRDVQQMDPESFVTYVSGRDSSDSTVQQVLEDTSVKLLIKNDAAPTYWTTFDDEHVVFDSFDSAVDTTLQKSKSIGYGILVPVFSMNDTYVPDIDDHLFPLLENEAKSQAFIELKQQQNPKAEQRARKLLTKHERREARLKKPNYLGPDFGRRGRQRHVNFDGV